MSKEFIDWGSVPLGKKYDKEIASDLGVPVEVVRKKRVKRGIPSWRTFGFFFSTTSNLHRPFLVFRAEIPFDT